MAEKTNRFGSGEMSNMFDFSHGLNRPQPTYRTPGTKQVFETDPQKPLIRSLSHVAEHPHNINTLLNLTQYINSFPLFNLESPQSAINRHIYTLKSKSSIQLKSVNHFFFSQETTYKYKTLERIILLVFKLSSVGLRLLSARIIVLSV